MLVDRFMQFKILKEKKLLKECTKEFSNGKCSKQYIYIIVYKQMFGRRQLCRKVY